MKIFNVEEANREPSLSVNLDLNSSMPLIPDVGEVKEYGIKNNLNYSVPRFIGKTHFYICTKYRAKHKREIWVTAINPMILSTEGLVFVEETQHGVEGIYVVPRHPRMLVAYTEAGTFKAVQKELVGLSALQFQQAIQAANGMFISDFGMKVDDDYLKATDEEKNEIVQEYFKALQEELDQIIEEDEDTKQYLKATEFLAENVERNNANEGVLPEDIQKQLNEEADKVDKEDA